MFEDEDDEDMMAKKAAMQSLSDHIGMSGGGEDDSDISDFETDDLVGDMSKTEKKKKKKSGGGNGGGGMGGGMSSMMGGAGAMGGAMGGASGMM